MKSFFKSVIALLICLCICLLAGCVKKNDNNNLPITETEPFVDTGAERPLTPEVITDEDIDMSTLSEAVITDEELPYLWSYSYLSSTEKRVYRIMLNMIRSIHSGWVDFGTLGSDHSAIVARAYRAVTNDFPEYYWIPSSYYITLKNGKIAVAFKKNDIEDGYGYTREQIQLRQEEFSAEIQWIISKLSNAKTDFEKELIIHDFLCERVVYGQGSSGGGRNDAYSAYGALVNRRAVCEGYARAFKLLCKYAGIESILITGDSKGVGHMWNMVKLDGEWYHVDVTWDDLKEVPLHTYLNVTELAIRIDHDIDATYDNTPDNLASTGNSYNFCVPSAQSTTYNYFYRNGCVLKGDIVGTASDELIKQYKAGKTVAELYFDNSNISEDFKNNYETYVVDIQKRCNEKLGKTYFKLKTIAFPASTCVIYFTVV